MADETPKTDPLKDLYFFLAIVVIIVILWYASGGASRADLRGILLSPPQPLGSGNSYNPEEPQFSGGTVAPPGQVQY
jgi:hypothetical protein